MKKKVLTYFIFLPVILPILGCANKFPVKEKAKIIALEAKPAPKINEIREETLKQTARGLAAQAGLAWRSYQLNLMLDQQKKYLDHIFNFTYLLLNQNVLPPVLVEGRNSLNLADEFTLRICEHDYQLVQLPRFVTTPPNWRDYIWMVYPKPDQPNHTLLPQDSHERKIWNNYIGIGWLDGKKQADEIFAENLARLTRDFAGMILYRKLLAKNMVTPPYVAKTDLGITGNEHELHINDRVLRITATPKLQVDPKNWHPIITIPKTPASDDGTMTFPNNKTIK